MICLEQPDGFGACGQCCIAMVAGITLDEAIKVLGVPGKGRRAGTTATQLRRGFALLGWRMGEWRRYRPGSELPPIAILGLSEKCKSGHWVAFEGPTATHPTGLVYDPNLGVPVPRDLFERYKVLGRGWKITGVYAVERATAGLPIPPEELAAAGSSGRGRGTPAPDQPRTPPSS